MIDESIFWTIIDPAGWCADVITLLWAFLSASKGLFIRQ